MASILKISADELRLARKGGYRRKKPRKPKQTSSLDGFNNWISRNNQWVKDAKSRASDYKKKLKLRDQIRNA